MKCGENVALLVQTVRDAWAWSSCRGTETWLSSEEKTRVLTWTGVLWLKKNTCSPGKQLRALATRAKRSYRPGRRRREAVRPQAARHHYLSQQSPVRSQTGLDLWILGGKDARKTTTKNNNFAPEFCKCSKPPPLISAATCACADLQPGCTWMDAFYHSVSVSPVTLFGKGQRPIEVDLPTTSSTKTRENKKEKSFFIASVQRRRY